MSHTVQGLAYVTTDEQAEAARAGHQAAVEEQRASRPAVADPRPLQRDVLVMMLDAGLLRPEQCRAGREIAEMVYATTAGIIGNVVARYDERITGSDADDWPSHMRSAYVERFRPWSEWAKAEAVKGLTFRQITLGICADNLGCKQYGVRHGIHRMTALRKLQLSLFWYAEQARWIDPLPDADFAA
ncbi:hypothetical protein EOD42_08950 [Rhodovarius crocodyli]|uniref:Uncharacterized protein n=1 Tax=Rhodovarius crocodyli TaxID=1979269 RepID=A0A437MJS3_9PROT|nr:hypothetical protein [Rhodovarius crocodyli]RVT97908.1 hypothetical protein EOD42_08950 [Rhodovarius crocodyli]